MMDSLFKRKVYETRREKTIDFIIGAVIWVVLNGIFLAITVLLANFQANNVGGSPLPGIASLAAAILPWVINIALMAFFAFTRSWIALGMLGMFGVILVLVSCAALLFVGYCFYLMSTGGGI